MVAATNYASDRKTICSLTVRINVDGGLSVKITSQNHTSNPFHVCIQQHVDDASKPSKIMMNRSVSQLLE